MTARQHGLAEERGCRGCAGADEAERQGNLKLFKAWVGNWTHKRFPDLTKEDLAGITVPY